MKIYLGKRTLLAFCAIITSIILVGIITYYDIGDLTLSQNWIAHTHHVIEEMNSVESSMLDLSASTRGYVITGNKEFLSAYDDTTSLLEVKLAAVDDLTKDNPAQQSNVRHLKDLVSQRKEVFSNLIKTREELGFAPASELTASGVGESLNLQIKRQLSSMTDLENSLLQNRIKELTVKSQNTTLLLFASTATIIGIAIALMVFFNKDSIAQMENQKKLMLEEQKSNELSEFNKLKDEFAAMITHELKTPIVPIIGYCKMLKTNMLGELNNDQQEAVDVINESTTQLVTLISDIMDARKLDLNKMKFVIEEIPLDDFFNNLNLNYKHILQQKGKEFNIDLPVHGLVISTDKTRLRQVFDNLISNAINFTPDKDGKITVGYKKEDNSIIFYIKDNGVGIPLEAQKNLFKKFYQVDTSERRQIGGTGLGLAISKGMVENLNGQLWVESDGHTGTTFYIKLGM